MSSVWLPGGDVETWAQTLFTVCVDARVTAGPPWVIYSLAQFLAFGRHGRVLSCGCHVLVESCLEDTQATKAHSEPSMPFFPWWQKWHMVNTHYNLKCVFTCFNVLVVLCLASPTMDTSHQQQQQQQLHPPRLWSVSRPNPQLKHQGGLQHPWWPRS